MHIEIPRECYLSLPAELTADLATARASKMNALFRVPLLGKSVTSLESALALFVDLARDLVDYDAALLFWREDAHESLQLRLSRGLEPGGRPLGAKGDSLCLALAELERPVLLSPTAGRLSEPTKAHLAAIRATSLVAMPVLLGGDLRGSLLLQTNRSSCFELADAQLLRAFAAAFEPILEPLSQGETTEDFAFLDGATGLFNRRFFDQHLEREMDRARRDNTDLSVLLVELDQLDQLKMNHGYAAAESFVQATATALRQLCRKSDTLARHKENTFGVILPKTGKDTLHVVARRVLEALQRSTEQEVPHGETVARECNLCSAVYPGDAFSVESLLTAAYDGLEIARTLPSPRYFQYPRPRADDEVADLLDSERSSVLREHSNEPYRLLNLFARLCLDTVPADRVSIMAKEDDVLVVQVALGFEGQDEVARTTRVPLKGATISSWIAQHREPLLVTGTRELNELPKNSRAAYKSDSFISFPLLENDELLGVVHFSNRSDGLPFTQHDLDSFRPIARVLCQYLAQGRSFAQAQEQFLINALFGLVEIMEQQIPGMRDHSAQVARLAEATARQLGYSEHDLARIRLSSRLHDLGNASFRSTVLAESRALSPRERTLAQRHPLLGWRFLESMPIADLDREAILYHHEREDGSGYFGKRGQDIPHSAKILAVADVFQALTSPRPYRPAIAGNEALAYLEGQKGTLFAPQVIDAFRAAVASTN